MPENEVYYISISKIDKNSFLQNKYSSQELILYLKHSKEIHCSYHVNINNEWIKCKFNRSKFVFSESEKTNFVIKQCEINPYVLKITISSNNISPNSQILSFNKKQLAKTKTAKIIFQDDFSDKIKWGANFHKGRYRGRVEDFNIISKLDSTLLKPNHRYEIAFEYYWVGKKSLNNVLIMEHINVKNEVLWFYTRPICSFPSQLKNKVKVKAVIQTQPIPCMYNIFLNAKGDGVEFEVDNLTIRLLD
jgi:hypothetical protein